MAKRNYLLLFLIFVIALSLRMFYLPQVAQELPVSDEAGYDEAAVGLASGEGYRMSGYRSYQPPGYPAFLAIVYKLFGHNYVIVKLIQVLLGSLGCFLIYLAAKRAFNKEVGLISALIYAAYDGLIFLNGHLLTENIFIILELLAIICLLNFDSTKSKLSLCLAGILIGLALLTRGQILYSIPFLIVWIAVISKRWLFHSFLLFLFVSLTVSPWTIRNYLIHRRFVPVATYTGESLYRFNYPNGMNVELARERKRFKELGLKEADMNSYYFKRVFEYIKDNPRTYLLDFFIPKLSWNLNEFFFGDHIWFPCSVNKVKIPHVPLISWRVLSLFSFMGFLLSFRALRRTSLLHFYLVPQLILTLTVLFAWTRFRLPIVPFFIIFAAFAIYSIFSLEYLKGAQE